MRTAGDHRRNSKNGIQGCESCRPLFVGQMGAAIHIWRAAIRHGVVR